MRAKGPRAWNRVPENVRVFPQVANSVVLYATSRGLPVASSSRSLVAAFPILRVSGLHRSRTMSTVRACVLATVTEIARSRDEDTEFSME